MIYGRRLQVIHRKEPMAWKGQRTASSGKNWWLVWACDRRHEGSMSLFRNARIHRTKIPACLPSPPGVSY